MPFLFPNNSNPGGHTNRLKLTILKERSDFRELIKKLRGQQEAEGAAGEDDVQVVGEPPEETNLEKARRVLEKPLHKRFSTQEIASSITLLACKSFLLIRFDELLGCTWQSKEAETKAPNLYCLSQLFNAVSSIIAEDILLCQDEEVCVRPSYILSLPCVLSLCFVLSLPSLTNFLQNRVKALTSYIKVSLTDMLRTGIATHLIPYFKLPFSVLHILGGMSQIYADVSLVVFAGRY